MGWEQVQSLMPPTLSPSLTSITAWDGIVLGRAGRESEQVQQGHLQQDGNARQQPEQAQDVHITSLVTLLL